ncbi:MAG: NHL repeat-containing protein [Pseudomonadota bacterium]
MRIHSAGSTIANPGYFSSIRDLAIGPDGNLYLLDGVQKRIVRMSTAGAPLGAISLPATSKASAFVFLANGNLLIADASNGKVLTLNASGQLLGSFNVFDLPVRPNEFFDIALDANGHLLVIDPDNNRIIKFDLSGAQPSRLGWLGGCSSGSSCIKAPGSSIGHTNGFCNGTVAQCGTPIAVRIPGGFERAFYVATDPAGDFYVTDLIQGVQHFSPTSAPLGALPRGRNVGQTGGGHIFVAANGDLYVADTGNNRVSRFSRAGAPITVVGGGVDISVMPGDTDLNRIALSEQTPTNVAVPAVVLVSSLGYTGPVTLAATACLRETASPPYVPCANYGLSTQLSKTTLSLTAGGQDTSNLTVTANTVIPGRTLNGKYLVAISAVDASGRVLVSWGGAAINVNLADKFGIVANPGQLKMFPGETKNVQLALTNLSGVAGRVDLETGVSPPQAAGHMSNMLTPNFVTTTRFAAVPTTPQLQIKLAEKARSGNPNINIFAKRAAAQIGNTTVDLQIDCNCRDTGAFVEPNLLTVIPSASNPLTGTSPSGTYIVNTGFIPSGAGPIPWVEIPGKVGQVSNAAAWGFSPNEKYFLVATLNASIPNQTYLTVYDLSAYNRIVQNTTIMGSALWGFSPDDKTFLIAHDVSVSPSRIYTLLAYDLAHAYSAPMLNQQFNGGNEFFRFSPCGDMIMHYEQRAVGGGATERDARFWALDGGHSPASQLLAKAVYIGNTASNNAPAARVVAASSIPTGSNGDFDVLLSYLAVQGSSRIDGFQSLQCRAR